MPQQREMERYPVRPFQDKIPSPSIIRWKEREFDHSASNTGYQLTGKHSAVLCANCHKDKTKSGHKSFLLRQTSCLSCHKDIHKNTLGPKCGSCHTTGGWKGGNLLFDHSRTKYKLLGAHAKAKCASCHHVKGVFKVMGFEKCVSCHKKNDVHKGTLGNACGKCHNSAKWKDTLFDHSRTKYPLVKKHTRVKCAKCHRAKGIYKVKGFGKCVTCHAKNDVHKKTLGLVCDNCHSLVGWNDFRLDHSKTNYPLAGKHTSVKCANCHKRARVNKIFRVKKFDTCDSPGCHDTRRRGAVHGEQFKGRNCAECHTVNGWKPVLFKHESANYKGFKLTGAHAKVKCAKCHSRGRNGVVRFRPIKTTSCNTAGCHDVKIRGAVHGEQFKGRNCAECHTVNGWKPVLFKHESANYKGFKLTGAHAKVKCAKCHKPNWKRVIVYKPIKTSDCATSLCHNNPHRSMFRGKKCDQCHTERSWKKLLFDHDKQSDYPLNGKHASVKCKKCHINNVWKPVRKDCYNCHLKKDVHKGSFGKRCADCHEEQSWKPNAFAHAVTGFPLEGAHAMTACKNCHTGKGAVKKIGEDCVECHTDPHFSQFGAFCSECHSAKSWGPLRFNHNVTGFRLEGAHRAADCQKCHVNRDYANTPVDCYSCHSKDFFRPGGASFHSAANTNCQDCHKTYSWTPATRFAHQSMTFTGAHKSIESECSKCHVSGSSQLLHPGAVFESDCVQCHLADYSKRHANGRPAGLAPCPQTCELCHNTSNFGHAKESVQCD